MEKSHIAFTSETQLKHMIEAAQGLHEIDLVIENCRFLDVFQGKFQHGNVAVHRGLIVGVNDHYKAKQVYDAKGTYLVPGFIDAHVHIESSLLVPSQFERAVLPYGTTTVIWDPHEIANVKGKNGIDWALSAIENLLLDIFVMVSSCVPATSPEAHLETGGAILHSGDIAEYRKHPRVLGLAEMMNYPGLLSGESDVLRKLMDYKHLRLDGHCPGLTGKELNAYAVAGIHSCHESITLAEAKEKLMKGIHVLIREGSCAKDADALLPLLDAYTSAVVALCSDDRNPADILAEGHLSCIIKKALIKGIAAETIFRAASYAPARLYNLNDRGAIAPGYIADFVMVEPDGKAWQRGFSITAVYKTGILVDSLQLGMRGQTKVQFSSKNLHMPACTLDDIQVVAKHESGRQKVNVIGVRPKQIVTDKLQATLLVHEGLVQADITQDVLKITVLERHKNTGQRSVGFVKGFNLKEGAIATSIAHDSHNVIAIGADDQLLLSAIRHLREIDGGIVVVHANGQVESLQLPVGGLMTDMMPEEVAERIIKMKKLAKHAGCRLEEPFLQLSFLALPVIPALKITDQGLIDVETFKKISVCV